MATCMQHHGHHSSHSVACSIMAVTLLTVVLATSVPTRLAPLIPAAEGIAQILMQVRRMRALDYANSGGVLPAASQQLRHYQHMVVGQPLAGCVKQCS
jgi:hypothetical protein